MKIALYIEDGLEQIVLTPESETEKAILGNLTDGSRSLSIAHGSFYECRGGWMRHEPRWRGMYGAEGGDHSTMIVLRPASGIEAATADATAQTGAAEGESPAPEGGDAQTLSQSPPPPSTKEP